MNSYDRMKRALQNPISISKRDREVEGLSAIHKDSDLMRRIEIIKNNKTRNSTHIEFKKHTIKELRDIHCLTFRTIGKLLDCDRTTILHLYK